MESFEEAKNVFTRLKKYTSSSGEFNIEMLSFREAMKLVILLKRLSSEWTKNVNEILATNKMVNKIPNLQFYGILPYQQPIGPAMGYFPFQQQPIVHINPLSAHEIEKLKKLNDGLWKIDIKDLKTDACPHIHPDGSPAWDTINYNGPCRRCNICGDIWNPVDSETANNAKEENSMSMLSKVDQFLIDVFSWAFEKMPKNDYHADIQHDLWNNSFHARTFVLETLRGKINSLGDNKTPEEISRVIGKEIWQLLKKTEDVSRKLEVSGKTDGPLEAVVRLMKIYSCFHKHISSWIETKKEIEDAEKRLKLLELASSQEEKIIELCLAETAAKIESENKQKIKLLISKLDEMLITARAELGVSEKLDDDLYI